MGKVDGRAGSALSNFLSPPCFSVTMGLFWDSSSLTSERRQFLGRGNILQSKVSSQCLTTLSFHCLIPRGGELDPKKGWPLLNHTSSPDTPSPSRALKSGPHYPLLLRTLRDSLASPAGLWPGKPPGKELQRSNWSPQDGQS